MRAAFFTIAGICLLLLVVYDVYSTILHSSARFGPIGEQLNRVIWRLAAAIGFRVSRPRRHRLLNSIGPILLPLLIFVYILLLITGFALLYYPRMPEQFLIAGGARSSTWTESFYFSGTTLTTVGFGDIVPRSNQVRFISLIESAFGLALISLAITYVLSVYGALERKRTIAISLYHQAEEGADVAGLVAHHFVDGKFYGLTDTLRLATRDIQSLLESHIEHPVIHYFHPVEVYKSLPRILFLLLETCSIMRSCLDAEEYADLCRRPEVRTLEASARHVLNALVASLNLERRAMPRKESNEEEERRWRRRYRQTMRRLDQFGIQVWPDVEAGWEEYRSQRGEWESKLHRIACYLGYDWDEVTGDTDLSYAANEEMLEPQVKP